MSSIRPNSAASAPPATRPCPVCQGEDVAGYNANYLRCGGCETIYYYKMPSEAELIEVYSGSLFKRVRRRLMAPFRKLHHRTTTAAERQRNGEVYRRSRDLAGVGPGEGRRFLDVGCNRGFLLEAAMEDGWDVWGVEFSPEQIQPFRNSYPHLVDQVRAGDFLEIARDIPDGHFHLITAVDVVEHFLDPRPAFAELARLLAPDGQFVLQTPSSKLADSVADGPAWGELKPAEHMTLFHPENLEAMAKELGFGDLRVDAEPFDHPRCNFVGVMGLGGAG